MLLELIVVESQSFLTKLLNTLFEGVFIASFNCVCSILFKGVLGASTVFESGILSDKLKSEFNLI